MRTHLLMLGVFLAAWALVPSTTYAGHFEDDFSEQRFTLHGLYSDAAKWYGQTGNAAGCRVVAENGVGHIVAAGGDVCTLTTHQTFDPDLHLKFDFMIDPRENDSSGTQCFYGEDTPGKTMWSISFEPPKGLVKISVRAEGNRDKVIAGFNIPFNTWATADVVCSGSNIKVKVTDRSSGVVFGEASSQYARVDGAQYPVIFKAQSGAADKMAGLWIDNVTIDPVKPSAAKSTLDPKAILAALQDQPQSLDEPTRTIKQSNGVTLLENETHWFMRNSEFEVIIEKATGSLCSLVSLVPSRLELVPLTSNGLVVYVWNQDADWFEAANSPVSTQANSTADGVKLQCRLQLANPRPSLAAVTLTYTLSANSLNIKAEVPFQQTDSSQYEIGMLHRYDRSAWNNHIYSAGHGGAVAEAADSDAMIRYFDDIHDTTTPAGYDYLHCSSYPQLTLEREDRYFLFGYLDLNTYAYISPNYLGDNNPAFRIRPKGTPAGKTYTFDVTYKTFAKSQCSYTDVLRWYMEHVYSTNPISRGFVTMPPDMAPRTLLGGSTTMAQAERYHIPGGMYGVSMEMAQDNLYHDAQDKANLENHFCNLWFAAGIKHNRWPDNGTPEAQTIRADIQRLQSLGYRIHMYFRQMYHKDDFYDDRPPYKKWLWRNKNGLLGSESVGIELGDFCNPDFVQWYIDEVKRTIDYYRPDGIGWDMSWFDGFFGVCSNHPENGGIHHGILRAQAEVFRYLKQHYPKSTVVLNCGRATISQLYANAVLEEGGWVAPTVAIDAIKAFRTPYIFVPYSDMIQQQYGKDNYIDVTLRLVFKALGKGQPLGVRGYDIFDFQGPTRSLWQSRMVGTAFTYPIFSQIPEITNFGGLACTIPWITESHAVNISPADDQLYASAWADAEHLLVSAFNESTGDRKISIAINKSILKQYGFESTPEFTFVSLSSANNARPVPNDSWKVLNDTGDQIILQGTLRSEELLLAQHGPGIAPKSVKSHSNQR